MDKKSRTIDIIKKYNYYINGNIERHIFISFVCDYFDFMKNEDLSYNNLKFLKLLAVDCGIPHYFDMLEKFGRKLIIDNIDLGTFTKMYKESGLFLDEKVMLHRSQLEVLIKMLDENGNRFLLTAPTSFGKTFIVNEYIKKKAYKNIVLIFPTIALLSENLERFHRDDYYSNVYSIHTLSNVNVKNDKNLFIYTPERFLSFLDVNPKYVFDFIFIDEMYKIDRELDNDDAEKSSERDLTYRIGVEESVKRSQNILLAGPYLKYSSNKENSLRNFLVDNNFVVIDMNQIEVVNKETVETNDRETKKFIVDDFELDFGRKINRRKRLIVLLEKFVQINNNCDKNIENSIIFCDTKKTCEWVALTVKEINGLKDVNDEEYLVFVSHIESRYSKDLLLCKCLRKGVAIHNSSIPKYIQKEIIKWFNFGIIMILVSTTTITEGVNTSTKNIIIYSNKKAEKPLRTFDAKNIVGRAGRFMEHYVGRIFYFDEGDKFQEILNSESKDLEHVNYDKNINKSDVDIDITREKYLNINDQNRKMEINVVVSDSNITEEVLESFKIFSRLQKTNLYNVLEKDYDIFKGFVGKIRKSMFYNGKLNYEAKMSLQSILNYIKPFVDEDKDANFLRLLEVPENGVQMIIISILDTYLKDGIIGIFRYNLEKYQKIGNSNAVNRAFSETSKTIYSILRYQMAKYLSLVDRVYKGLLINVDKIDEEIAQERGLFGLLELLEYGARTEDGKLCSDFGVPYRVLRIVEENPQTWNKVQINLDQYDIDAFEENTLKSFREYIQNVKN